MRERLWELDYSVSARVYNARHFAVPQHRERVIIVGFDKKLFGEDPGFRAGVDADRSASRRRHWSSRSTEAMSYYLSKATAAGLNEVGRRDRARCRTQRLSLARVQRVYVAGEPAKEV